MSSIMPFRLAVVIGFFAAAALAQKYDGPKPPKSDVPYLLHASNLIETEVSEAKEETKKDERIYAVFGPSSPARTPLAEPIFLFESDKIRAEKLNLYRMNVKNGRREIVFNERKRKDNPRPVILSISRLSGNLYRVEVNEGIDNGEYCLSPDGTNDVFCFQVY